MFLNLLRCVLWPKIWSILVNVGWKRMCNLKLLDEVVYRCQLYLVDGWCCCLQLCPYWFSACWIYFSQKDVKVSNYNSGFIYFSLKFYPLLPNIIWPSVVRHIHIKYYYVFLGDRMATGGWSWVFLSPPPPPPHPSPPWKARAGWNWVFTLSGWVRL